MRLYLHMDSQLKFCTIQSLSYISNPKEMCSVFRLTAAALKGFGLVV